MPLADLQKLPEVLAGLGAPTNTQEVDELNEQARLACARLSHDVDQFAQARQEAIVTNAQQRAAGYVANAGRLDDYHCRTAAREALIPCENVVADEAVFRGAPRDHRRHPGPRWQR
jgi:hypothetical protein